MVYLRTYALIVAAVLAALAAFNLAVDPYGVLAMPVRPGFNQAKAINHRFVKPIQVVAAAPEVVVFGSSRVLHGIDPAQMPNHHVYNFGVPAATLTEMAACCDRRAR